MLRVFKYTCMLLCLTLCLVSCKKDDDSATPESLPVTYINLAGNWQLVTLDNHPMAPETYLYIYFERREHNFEMYYNTGSMYGEVKTGTYLLEEDEKTETTVLSGTYDHWVGEWNNTYTVTQLTTNRLVLTTRSTPQEVQVFQRVDVIPVRDALNAPR
ncbi:MAG: lipocalin family protein [Bacteroidaceae bacterium]|nr:lipocalin family protein [Bacteroidaceae bacterium]